MRRNVPKTQDQINSRDLYVVIFLIILTITITQFIKAKSELAEKREIDLAVVKLANIDYKFQTEYIKQIKKYIESEKVEFVTFKNGENDQVRITFPTDTIVNNKKLIDLLKQLLENEFTYDLSQGGRFYSLNIIPEFRVNEPVDTKAVRFLRLRLLFEALTRKVQ